ncbi:MAG: DUF4335 domain-containing protein [Oscillatoriales cyanobacterium]|nr:MAG: DUF4335 domain-containing protein [Oscillatoriales cyanobacterium]
MTIQRQYSLPNCVLTLEGMDSLAELGDARPTLSVLLKVTCQFPAHNFSFACDRTFFEQFARVVSQYAQSGLSGIRSPQLPLTLDTHQPNITLMPAEGGKHKLLLVPPPNPEGPDEQTARPGQVTEILLTPLQLFDLVETIDQVYGDPKTLPDAQQLFAPVSRHDLANAEPLVQRAAPVAVGASGLAVAAGVLFLLPVPKVQQPKDVLRPKPTPTPQSQASPQPQAQVPPSPSRPEPSVKSIAPASPAASPVAVASPAPNPNPNTASPKTASLNTGEIIPTAKAPSTTAGSQAADALIAPAKPITNRSQLAALERYLYGELNNAWKDRQAATIALNYRVSVGEDGSIIGYLPENVLAQSAVNQTPLPELLFTPLDRSRTGEPTASFQVSFSQAEGVQVTPMKSVSSGDGAPQQVQSPRLNDGLLRAEARTSLEKSLRSAWSRDRAPSMPLMYDVQVNRTGEGVNFKAANRSAASKGQFPLPQLLKLSNSVIKGANGKIQLAPLAEFRVIFWPDGSIDVRP